MPDFFCPLKRKNDFQRVEAILIKKEKARNRNKQSAY
jgi:hypothetical protein